jgi:hypothetical protein
MFNFLIDKWFFVFGFEIHLRIIPKQFRVKEKIAYDLIHHGDFISAQVIIDDLIDIYGNNQDIADIQKSMRWERFKLDRKKPEGCCKSC